MKVKGQAEKSAIVGTSVARSFFSFNRLPLEFRPSEKRRLTKGKSKYEDYRFSREDLKTMSDVSDLQEKYVVIVGKSFGLRAGDFLKLTRGDLEPYIDREPPISIGEYDTQKENVKAFPFIDRDAKHVIELMLKSMDNEGRTDSKERMLDLKSTSMLSIILRRVTQRAGIETGTKRVRFHCLRKFLCDHLSSYMSESKWKQVVGKTISEGAYVSPDTLRNDYRRVMEVTCFPKAEVDEFMLEYRSTKQSLRAMGILSDEKEREMDEAITRASREERPTIFRKFLRVMKEKRTEEEREKLSLLRVVKEARTKVVDESALENDLNHGWKFVSVLPSGKILIERT